jgi:hypothetical protein
VSAFCSNLLPMTCAIQVSLPCNLLGRPQAAEFIKPLWPTLHSAELGRMCITCCDATGWNVQKLMSVDLITRVASHSDSSNPSILINTTRPVWETGYRDLNNEFSTTWCYNGAPGEGVSWQTSFTTATRVQISVKIYIGNGIADDW